MIVGSVRPNGDALIGVRLRGPAGAELQSDALIDTGFNDFPTLSRPDIDRLELSFRGEGRYVLADETEITSRLFTAEIDWVGRWRRIIVVEMAGGPLVGMALIRGSHLGIDVVDGGRVEIRPLDS